MTDFDDTFVPFALATIKANGTDGIFKTVVQTFNRATGATADVETIVTRKISPPSQVSQHMLANSLIHAGDMQALVAASGLTFTPVRNMRMTWNGTDWTLVDVRLIPSGDSIAAYRLIFRQ